MLEYSGDALTRRWLHSTSVDEPVGFEEYTNTSGVGSGTERAMFADRQGSVIWVTEPATGAVVAGYEYSGYGVPKQVQGTLSQPYGYTGREYDAESGLYHYRARAYDPTVGTFVQVDPIEFESGTLNIYSYVQQDPINWIDPDGHAALYGSGGSASQLNYSALTVQGAANAANAAIKVGKPTITLAGKIGALMAAMSVGSDVPHSEAAAKVMEDARNMADCHDKYTWCQATPIVYRRSSNYGRSRCQDCFEKCQRDGVWPEFVDLFPGKGSCLLK